MALCPDASLPAFASQVSYGFQISSMIFHRWDWLAPKRREINGKLAPPPSPTLPTPSVLQAPLIEFISNSPLWARALACVFVFV